MSRVPRPYDVVKKNQPDLMAAYEELGRQCHGAGPLDEKTRELVKLGIAIGARHEGAAHAHARLALQRGATPAELRHVVFLATTTLGFPMMMTARSWVHDVLSAHRGRGRGR